MPESLTIGSVTVEPGQRVTIDLPVARLTTHTELTMPLQVIHGKQDGPRLFVSAAVHGDELNGVEIIRRLLELGQVTRLRGTLVAVPMVNVFGFMNTTRYLPDRRDLNRSFPGSKKGSLAARLANLFMREIVANCTHGIDLHTGSNHRSNLPQIRAYLDDPETKRLALSFGAPVILNTDLRDGSLREAAVEQGIPVLLYEGGEALRFDETVIQAGVRGIVAVMRSIGMLPRVRRRKPRFKPTIALSSSWVRAPESGILRTRTELGQRVAKKQTLGTISDPFGEKPVQVTAQQAGIVIGRLNLPLVNEGEAIFHIASFASPATADQAIEAFHATLEPEGLN